MIESIHSSTRVDPYMHLKLFSTQQIPHISNFQKIQLTIQFYIYKRIQPILNMSMRSWLRIYTYMEPPAPPFLFKNIFSILLITKNTTQQKRNEKKSSPSTFFSITIFWSELTNKSSMHEEIRSVVSSCFLVHYTLLSWLFSPYFWIIIALAVEKS